METKLDINGQYAIVALRGLSKKEVGIINAVTINDCKFLSITIPPTQNTDEITLTYKMDMVYSIEITTREYVMEVLETLYGVNGNDCYEYSGYSYSTRRYSKEYFERVSKLQNYL